MMGNGEADRHALAVAREAAMTAGRAVTAQWARFRASLRYKGHDDVVTAADMISDEIISAHIGQAFAGHRILSEESAGCDGFDFSGPLWVVDPIDGSANYARGHRYFGIAVAFAIDGVVRAACVHAPALGETFTAVKGRGAFLNGVAISPAAPTDLARAVVSTGFPHDKSDMEPLLRRVAILLGTCQDVRRSAAPVLDIAYVAAGRLDAHTETLFAWDVAAAGLIATEAGIVRSHLGQPSRLLPPDLDGGAVLFAAPSIHRPLSAVLRETL